MTIPDAWLAERHQAVLVTLRADRSPQTSNVAFAFRDGVARVSVTDDRAKTHNLRRDPRAVLHVLGDSFWQYASVRVTAELSAVSTELGDAVGSELLEVYEAITGAAHPDPDEFYGAMVQERRLVLTLTPQSAVGQGLE
ncbi:MAG TPA: PPOX class F420-dependent oxidoreductase [Mycobacteriales bacterium]|nr:PPOX class F420-dependent oxidoreductase [Mycobacteriales bacterium]